MAKTTNSLPVNLEAEQAVLSAIMVNPAFYAVASEILKPEDFSLSQNQIIFQRMSDVTQRGEGLDRLTVANELTKRQELDSCGGLTYLTSLEEGGLNINPAQWAQIVAEKSRLRQYITAARDLARSAMAQQKPSSEIYQEAQRALNQIAATDSGSKVEKIYDWMARYPGGMNTMLDPAKWQPGIKLGFDTLDEWTAGIHEKEIFLFGARPGAGKTAFMSQICKSLGFRKIQTLIFSMEMSKEMLIQRMFCQEAGVALDRFRRGELLDDERTRILESAGIVSELPIWIDETSGLTVSEIRARLQAQLNERPIALCAIDFVQLIRPERGRRYQNENEMFTQIANDLQEMCKVLGTPLLLLSQLNRESEKGKGDRPKLSQARGSGSLEQISNLGALLFREWLARKDRDDMRDRMELIVDKNRSGPSGTIKMRFIPYLMKFEEREGGDE